MDKKLKKVEFFPSKDICIIPFVPHTFIEVRIYDDDSVEIEGINSVGKRVREKVMGN